jgi:hypothetical protein
LTPAETYFGFPAAPNNPFSIDKIDSYSDGFLNDDVTSLPWSGSDSTNVLFDAQELYSSGLLPTNTVLRLKSLSSDRVSPDNHYNRYTFYRMLAQMGVDSRPASRTAGAGDFELYPTNKIHLNYQPASGEAQRRGIAWDPEFDWSPPVNPQDTLRRDNPTRFFHLVADRLLRASLTTNVLADSAGRPRYAFALGATPVRRDISITNIQIFPPRRRAIFAMGDERRVHATLHRVLQVAANIYDATTSRRIGTNEYPSVFRPLFRRAEARS